MYELHTFGGYIVNRFQLLASAAVLALGASQAGAVTYNLSVEAENGLYAGLVGTGTITWDETLVNSVGYTALTWNGAVAGSTADNSLRIDLTAGPEIFTHTDDINWPDFPLFSFMDGLLTSINYIVMDYSTPVDLASYGVQGFSFNLGAGAALDGDTVYASAIVKYLDDPAPVPLPAGLPLLAGGLGLLALARRRRA